MTVDENSSLARIRARYFTDPGCPWGYSWRPTHARLLWRFGAQIEWNLSMIGLSDTSEDNIRKGLTPASFTVHMRSFREQFGMPFELSVKDRLPGTSRACKAVVAVRTSRPELADPALRALQLMNFTSARLFDRDEEIREALREVEGLDADAIVAGLDDLSVAEAYRADHAAARTAESRPAEAQDRHSEADGVSRYTAPTVIFEQVETGQTAEIGGFQRFETYDTALANIDPALERRPVPEDAFDVLAAFPHGLTTAEVAAVLRPSELEEDDVAEAERQLLMLAGEKRIAGVPFGGDALWRIPAEEELGLGSRAESLSRPASVPAGPVAR